MPEFALVAPVLFLIIFGVFDFGHAIVDYVALQHAVNDGGRVVSEGYPSGGDTSLSGAYAAQTTSAVQSAAIKDTTVVALVAQKTSCPNGPIPALATLKTLIPANQGWVFVTEPEPESTWGSQPASISVGNAPAGDPPDTSVPRSCYATAPASGSEPLQVTVVYHFAPITPLIGNIIGNNLMLFSYSVYETEY